MKHLTQAWSPCLFSIVFSTLMSASSSATPPPTGSISSHRWDGIGGVAVSDLTSNADYPDSPDVATTDTDFHAPSNVAENFGRRMFGWVHAPVTGNYTFWFHSDDQGELWLSTTESPDDRRLIANVPDFTGDGEWTKHASQQSVSIPLVAGEYYFIEALMKEAGGGDNLGVAWSYTGQSRTYIPGSQLSPWQNIAPEGVNDSFTVGVGGSIGAPVLQNDIEPNGSSDFDLSTLQVISAPSDGTTQVDTSSGMILYTHTGNTAGVDNFTYRVRDMAGLETTATVTLTISNAVRLPHVLANVPAAPPSESLALESAFGFNFSQPVDAAILAGDTQRLWISEKGGDIRLVPDVTSLTPSNLQFLNLDGIINARANETFLTFSEQGLLGTAMHPNYAVNGYFFTVYNVRVNGLDYQRLSRWTDPNPSDNTASGATEQVLIQMRNQAANHNGGDLEFGPDGYLYVSWGDEGNQNDSLNNSQFIDKDFWSSIIRIDVDLEAEDYTVNDGTGSDDDSVAPNSHPAIVLHSDDPLYEVPLNNPWVGATSFNGVSVTASQVRTEFFAVGFRNPWRFSFDSQTGELWCGDVGQGAREEVAVIEMGSNHGWAWREGKIAGAKNGQTINGASQANATLTDPEYDYTRGSGEFQGNSVSGGVVSRGNNVVSLFGKYIFADYVSGNIWSLERTATPGSPTVERILGEGNVVGFGTDPSNGDVLVVDLNGPLHRIVAQSNTEEGFPLTLAETGLFADPQTRTPNPGLVAYDVNVPFWSDHAIKSRWFAIPNSTDTFTYMENGSWGTPEGSVFVKHFNMLQDDSDPNSAFPIETRLIVRNSEGSYGVSYRWNSAGTEATLVDSAGVDFPISVTRQGSFETQTWRIPSRAECSTCHNEVSGGTLSFNTRQLNKDVPLAGITVNLIDFLRDSNYLSNNPPSPHTLPRHVPLNANEFSFESRVRTYFDVNCAYCHQPGGGVASSFDLRHQLTMDQTGIINGTLNNPASASDRLIIPGNTSHSAMLSRVSGSNGYSRMPPIGSNELDKEAIDLLTAWINGEATEDTTYTKWRITNFGNDTSLAGEPQQDPDGDGDTNEEEYLKGTNPNNVNSVWNLSVSLDSGDAKVQFPGVGNSSILIEHSTDLSNWDIWDAPGNNGVPRNPTMNHEFVAPMVGEKEFFRAQIIQR